MYVSAHFRAQHRLPPRFVARVHEIGRLLVKRFAMIFLRYSIMHVTPYYADYNVVFDGIANWHNMR